MDIIPNMIFTIPQRVNTLKIPDIMEHIPDIIKIIAIAYNNMLNIIMIRLGLSIRYTPIIINIIANSILSIAAFL
jgi:hypothetical protein